MPHLLTLPPKKSLSRGAFVLWTMCLSTVTVSCGQDPVEQDPGVAIIVTTPPELTRCAQDEYVLANTCTTCPPSTTRPAGDDPSLEDTRCIEPIGSPASSCHVNERVMSNRCVPCEAGETREAGDETSGADTRCAPSAMQSSMCAEDEHVVDNVCTPCEMGSVREAGDVVPGPETMCTPDDPLAQPCGVDEHVVGGECVSCEMGSAREAGDEPERGDTSCEAVTCIARERVQDHQCVACEPGRFRAPGDLATGTDTSCEPELCAVNEAVSAHTCVSCEMGSTRGAGDMTDGGDTRCEPTACAINEAVSQHTCVACPAGTTRAAGDLATGEDTACEVTFCLEDEHVVNHRCVTCAVGTQRPAGDDASGADTSCTSGGLSALSVSAGEDHTCAVTTAGGVVCWGANQYGQLGNGSIQQSSVPVPVQGITGTVVAVSAGGDHSCALTQGGAAWCWGANYSGQLGNGSMQQGLTASRVAGLSSGIVQISAGWTHTCAVSSVGEALCWGDNYSGQLGTGNTTGTTFAVIPTGMSFGVSAISAGGAHTCAVLNPGGDVWCWGRNNDGQLGLGNTTSRTQPSRIPGPYVGADMIAAGKDHTCVVASGGVKCWGFNFFNQVSSTANRPSQTSPANVSGASSGYFMVDGGQHHTCAVRTTGAWTCWGHDGDGQLGNYAGRPTDFVHIDTGWTHGCGVRAGGAVVCWGDNSSGALGDGTRQNVFGFVEVGAP